MDEKIRAAIAILIGVPLMLALGLIASLILVWLLP